MPMATFAGTPAGAGTAMPGTDSGSQRRRLGYHTPELSVERDAVTDRLLTNAFAEVPLEVSLQRVSQYRREPPESPGVFPRCSRRPARRTGAMDPAAWRQKRRHDRVLRLRFFDIASISKRSLNCAAD